MVLRSLYPSTHTRLRNTGNRISTEYVNVYAIQYVQYLFYTVNVYIFLIDIQWRHFVLINDTSKRDIYQDRTPRKKFFSNSSCYNAKFSLYYCKTKKLDFFISKSENKKTTKHITVQHEDGRNRTAHRRLQKQLQRAPHCLFVYYRCGYTISVACI